MSCLDITKNKVNLKKISVKYEEKEEIYDTTEITYSFTPQGRMIPSMNIGYSK